MTIESLLEEFEQFEWLIGDGKMKGCLVYHEEAKNWLTKQLAEYRNSVIDECLEVVPQRATERNMARVSNNISLKTVGEVEAWNEIRSQTILNIYNLKV